LASLVTEQHRAAQETHLVETYVLARDIYKEYLDKFTESTNSYKFRFYYSEILFELKEFKEAALQYQKVVDADPSGEFVKPAAYTAVMAWEKVVLGVKEEVSGKIQETKQGKAKGVLQKLETLAELTKGQDYAATPLTADEQALANACDVLVQVAPKDEDVVKTKFKSARLYYVHNQFEEAAKRFGEIIDRWPQDSLARLGAHSIVQSFNVRKDWKQLNVWARKIRGNERLMAEAKFKKAIEHFVEGASFNEIHEGIERSGDVKATADAYVAFADEFPKSMYAIVALYNAVINNDKAGQRLWKKRKKRVWCCQILRLCVSRRCFCMRRFMNVWHVLKKRLCCMSSMRRHFQKAASAAMRCSMLGCSGKGWGMCPRLWRCMKRT
jgi:TolA-binding protein